MSDLTAVVTGASTGIGAATARHLSERGFAVFGSVRRPEDADRLRATGIHPLLMDVTDGRAIDLARGEVERVLAGRSLSGLVNNAGIPVAGPLEYLEPDALRRVLEVNVVGVLRVTQAFLPMLRRGRGRIVNMSSVSGLFAYPFGGPYAASKFALEALSDAWRRELIPFGVDVVIIEPGAIRTPIWERVAELDAARYAGTPYQEALERTKRFMLKSAERGYPPEVVAQAVHRALTAAHPPARIPVIPFGSLSRLLLRMLPSRWTDRLIAKRAYGAGSSER